MRQQRLVYARLIAAMRLPAGLDEASPPKGQNGLKRPQLRGIRGIYSIGSA